MEKIVNIVEQAESWRDSTYRDNWQRYYKQWRNFVPKKTDGRSHISIPYVLTQIETIVPRIRETLFASRPYVTVHGRGSEDDAQAKANEILLDWQMNERIDFPYLFENAIRQACVYGTAISYSGWKYDEKQLNKKVTAPLVDDYQNPIESEPRQLIKVTEVGAVYDDPDVKFLDIMGFFIDTRATSIDDARFCGHLEYKTKEELKHTEALLNHAYKIDWKKLNEDEESDKGQDFKREILGTGTSGMEMPKDKKFYEVMHYWEDDRHVVIINRKQKVLDEPNPFWYKKKPYDAAHYIRVPNEFYGIGIVELIEDLQQTLNTERNLRIDYRKAGLARMWSVRKDSGINSDDLLWKPDGIIEVNQHDDIKEIIVQQMPMGSIDEEMLAKQDMKDATGAQDVVMGVAGSPSETATATMTKDNNAAMRFRMMINNFERDLLCSIGTKMLSMNQQFMSEERIVRVLGENSEYVKIAPEDIQGDFDMIPMGSSTEPIANKNNNRTNIMNLYNIMAQSPLMQAFPDKQREVLKKVLEAFDVKDINAILPTVEEIQIQQQQQMQMQQQQMELQKQQMQAQLQLDKEKLDNSKQDKSTKHAIEATKLQADLLKEATKVEPTSTNK